MKKQFIISLVLLFFSSVSFAQELTESAEEIFAKAMSQYNSLQSLNTKIQKDEESIKKTLGEAQALQSEYKAMSINEEGQKAVEEIDSFTAKTNQEIKVIEEKLAPAIEPATTNRKSFGRGSYEMRYIHVNAFAQEALGVVAPTQQEKFSGTSESGVALIAEPIVEFCSQYSEVKLEETDMVDAYKIQQCMEKVIQFASDPNQSIKAQGAKLLNRADKEATLNTIGEAVIRKAEGAKYESEVLAPLEETLANATDEKEVISSLAEIEKQNGILINKLLMIKAAEINLYAYDNLKKYGGDDGVVVDSKAPNFPLGSKPSISGSTNSGADGDVNSDELATGGDDAEETGLEDDKNQEQDDFDKRAADNKEEMALQKQEQDCQKAIMTKYGKLSNAEQRKEYSACTADKLKGYREERRENNDKAQDYQVKAAIEDKKAQDEMVKKEGPCPNPLMKRQYVPAVGGNPAKTVCAHTDESRADLKKKNEEEAKTANCPTGTKYNFDSKKCVLTDEGRRAQNEDKKALEDKNPEIMAQAKALLAKAELETSKCYDDAAELEASLSDACQKTSDNFTNCTNSAQKQVEEKNRICEKIYDDTKAEEQKLRATMK